jgi:arylsulfatase A-like enzyme
MKQTTSSPALSNRALLTIALFLAAFVGLTESALLALARFGLDRFTHLNPHFAYLAPLWYMAAVLFVVAPLLVFARIPKSRVRMTIAVLPIALVGGLGVLFLYGRLNRWAALVLATGVAIQATRVAIARSSLLHRVARFGLPVLGVAIAVIAAALHIPYIIAERRALAEITPDDEKPNVLFIIWDTVRAASLSLYGYERPTTPTLDRLSVESVVFDRAYAVAPWTLPSHASFLTGRAFHELSTDWLTPLDDEPVTLAELFARKGYATGGFVANYFYCSRESGLDRGFHRYDVYPAPSFAEFILGSSVSRVFFNSWGARRTLGFTQKPGRKEASGVNVEFQRWLDRLDGKPFFAFLNYFDAHAPYLPPSPWDTMFGPILPGRDPSMREGRSWTPRELQAEIDGYDGGIRSLDDHLALLLDDLERRGILDNTIVIVTSDHGEEFGEYGVFTHGNTLYERSLHVPLLIHYPPRLPGVRVGDWVSIRDVAATVASLTGLDAGLGGTSLERFWSGAERAPADTLLAQVSYARGHPPDYPVSKGDMQTILAAPYQYVRRGDDEEQLFDLTDSLTARIDLRDRPEAAPALRSLRHRLDRTLRRPVSQ